MKLSTLEHRFVEFLPDVLDEGVLYVSIPYAIAEHKCCCGCGERVITPLSPTDWSLTFDGKTVSLRPSIGNWSFPCQSHYWIRRNEVTWAPRWTSDQIEAGRAHDRRVKTAYYAPEDDAAIEEMQPLENEPSTWNRFLGRLKRWFRGKDT